jgi:tetratricopeptide (TPR) repeat protein
MTSSQMKKPRPKPRQASSTPGLAQARAKPEAAAHRVSLQRQWAFRLGALVLAPLLFFSAVELALRLAGTGYPTSLFLRRGSESQAVLVDNPKFSWRFFGPALARAPWPFQIPETKEPGTVRVFVLGESAAYGDPQPEFGLARMLEVLLHGRYPGVRFEVVNAALTGINSHALLEIARDCAQEQSDIWVVYLGNNEVVGPYGAGTVFGRQVPGLGFIRSSLALRSTRTGQMLETLWQRAGRGQSSRKGWEGMKMFVGQEVGPQDPRLTAVYHHFEHNLADLVRAGRARKVGVVLSTVASNLKDCAPFASLHRPGLTGARSAEWDRLYRAGVAAQQAGTNRQALELFEAAARMDGEYADLQFRWAQCCLAAGQEAEARAHFTLARDCDALRFRTDTQLNEIIRKTAQGQEAGRVFLADAEQELARQSPHGVPGDETFWEHVHLTFDGNYRLARTIAEQVSKALPEKVAVGATQPGAWPSAAECAARLAHGKWNRYEATASMLMRINDPPFTQELNHAGQFARLQAQLEELRSALQPQALREAIELCRQAAAQAPQDWVFQKQLGRLLEQTGVSAGAVQAWESVVRLLPYSAAGHCGLGGVLSRQKHLEAALREYETALSLDPGSSEALSGMGLALVLQGRKQDALQVLRRMLNLRPESPEAHLNMAWTLRSTEAPAEAERHLRLAYERRPSDPGFLDRLAKACAGFGWTNEAVAAWSEAVRLQPTDAAAHLNLGIVMAAAGQSEAALEHYARVVQLEPSQAEARLRLGTELGRRGQHVQAQAQFAAAVRLKPDFLQARLNLGIVLVELKRFEEASKEFLEALRIDPANATARQYLDAIEGRTPARP